MTQIRTQTKSQWNIPKHLFYSAYHYALQYAEWKDEYMALQGLSSGGNDGMPHGSGTSNPTEAKGIRSAELKCKMNLIEETAKEADEQLYKWILKAVTHEGITYTYLSQIMRMPCGHNLYYDRRRKFYYLLSQKLDQKIGNQGTENLL